MPVFRVERNKGYTVMSNYHLRDKSLSLKAKGLMTTHLSSPASVFICYIAGIEFTGSACPQLQCARRTLPGRPYHR